MQKIIIIVKKLRQQLIVIGILFSGLCYIQFEAWSYIYQSHPIMTLKDIDRESVSCYKNEENPRDIPDIYINVNNKKYIFYDSETCYWILKNSFQSISYLSFIQAEDNQSYKILEVHFLTPNNRDYPVTIFSKSLEEYLSEYKESMYLMILVFLLISGVALIYEYFHLKDKNR